MVKNVFKVNGMKCQHCKMNVEAAIKGVSGVESAEVNLEESCVKVEYDDTLVAPKQLKDVVESAGRFEMLV